ncbi:helix-turn-helix domain-containing protein [Methylomonas rapida]|uniref:Helix-turn-helix domain-containing protein n=1 Tax=Methylomonas rapida TaxID=2963939 RepID=A0ABY7GR23_9GAMM|nr:helix-turn-helix domain-containing protein [Methylomonas rapida]WAR46959.1 helix-turn-helix domain-containing protein [Methylomonas rapida]
MDIEKVAQAIEDDAGMMLDDLRQGLAEMQTGEGRITTPEQILVRAARAKTGLSQQAFAERIQTPAATLRDWEQGRFTPPGGVLCLLKIIMNHPDLMSELDVAA